MEVSGDYSYWCVYAMRSGVDDSHVLECGDESDGSVDAHSEVACIVKEDDTCDAVWGVWFCENGANHGGESSWF